MTSVGTIIDQIQLWQCWSKELLLKVFEDDSDQAAHARIYGVFAADNLRSDCFLWCSSYAKHENSNIFELCCFSFQPSQSNICLLKSIVSCLNHAHVLHMCELQLRQKSPQRDTGASAHLCIGLQPKSFRWTFQPRFCANVALRRACQRLPRDGAKWIWRFRVDTFCLVYLENRFEAGLKSIPLWVFSSCRIPVACSNNKTRCGASPLFVLLGLIKAPSTLFLHTRACLLPGGPKQREFLPDRWLNSAWIDLVCMDVQHVRTFKACARQWSWLPRLPQTVSWRKMVSCFDLEPLFSS